MSVKRKKILAVTGIRSEYDILYPMLDELRKDPRFEVKLVVCGAHLSEWHGHTIRHIEADGFDICDRVDYLLMTNRKTQRAKGVGILIAALTQSVEREQPDFLLVIGDREESIATAIVGNYLDILVAHIGGGDPAYGNADDPIRHAVSKIGHIHFTLAQVYADNLKRIGEEEFRIFNVGNPSLDNIRLTKKMSMKAVSKAIDFDITDGKYIVLLKHPLSSEEDKAFEQMCTTLRGIELFCAETGFRTVVIHPNTDPGSYDILNALKKFRDKPFVRCYKTLPREVFINLMRNTAALIGNSSMGILEGPYYGIPVINVGNRQKGRLNAGNVEFVGYDAKAIERALSKACFDGTYRKRVGSLTNPYGNGRAARKVKRALLSISPADKKWHVKTKLC